MARNGNGRAVGAVIGVSAIAGAAFLIWRLPRAGAASLGSPREREYGGRSRYESRYADRYRSLVRRGAQGERWRDAFVHTAPSGYDSPAWIDAVVKWTGIESAGVPTDVTGGKELGLLQINRGFATELGFTKDELDRYIAKGTSDDDRAVLSWRYVKALSKPAQKVSTPDDKARAWVAYMRHALPLLLQELAAQGFLVDGPASGTLNAAWTHYAPGGRVGAYAAGGGGTVAQQLLNRFVAAADVVAGYDRSAAWG